MRIQLAPFPTDDKVRVVSKLGSATDTKVPLGTRQQQCLRIARQPRLSPIHLATHRPPNRERLANSPSQTSVHPSEDLLSAWQPSALGWTGSAVIVA